MPQIMPAGKAQVDWSPKIQEEDEMVKHSSTNKAPKAKFVSDKDALVAIAKRVLAEREDLLPFMSDEDSGVEDVEDVEEVSIDGIDGIDGIEDVEEVGVEAAIGKVEDALEDVTEAIAEVKAEVCDDPIEDEIEIPIGDGEGIVEIEVEEPEIPGETSVEDDTVVEGREERLAKDEVDAIVDGEDDSEDEVAIEASTDDDFIRLSKISPANRKKLYTYWTQDLGYPKDYCKLLVQDYEK